MLTLPQEMMNMILPFVALFSERVWDYARAFPKSGLVLNIKVEFLVKLANAIQIAKNQPQS